MAVDVLIGSELAGYRIEALVGRGGMGVVYRAEHLLLGRRDALKVLSPELAQDADFRERFLRESRTAAALDHPNIIPIYHAGEADGMLYIAMRYVDGTDLRDLLKRDGSLDAGRAVAMLEQVAEALDVAHESGLVHRDVKPANILIAAQDRVYLSDFGIAKQSDTRGLTKTGSFVGTLDYASPEQIEGKDLDGRADLYSLGCVLCECLTGTVPYKKDSEVQVLYAHLLEPPPLLTARRPDLGAEVDAVIAKALAKSPQERYSNCTHLVAAVRRALARRAASVSRATPPPVAATRAASKPAAPTPEREPAPPRGPSASTPFSAPPTAERTIRGGRRLWIVGAAALVLIAAVVAGVALTRNGSRPSSDLLSRIPPALRDGCQTGSRPPGATAAVFCGAGTDQASSYYTFPTKSSLDKYYGQQLAAAGLARGDGRCDREPFHGERPYAVKGRAAGRVYCGLDSTGAFVAWIDTAARIYAHASRPDANAVRLVRWWAGVAGPVAAGSSSVPTKSAALRSGTVIFRDNYRLALPRANQISVKTTDDAAGGPLLFGDVGIKVRARKSAGPATFSFGVVCRYGPEAFYELDVRSDGQMRIRQAIGSKLSILVQRDLRHAVSSGVLTAGCRGGGSKPVSLTLALNGGPTLAAKSPKSRFPTGAGAVGVLGQSFDQGGVVLRFDRFTVTTR